MDAGWLIAEPEVYEEYDLGPLKTGKEADVSLVERVSADGRSCLLAHKRYRPRSVTHKGQLDELGFERAASFVHDAPYREGRALGNSRDRRAAARKSRYGRAVLGRGWADNEFAVLGRLAEAGVTVPLPVARTGDGVLMQYVGDEFGAAPPFAQARLDRTTLERAATQLVDDVHRMARAGIVHADLSVFNLLWWDARVWIIDVPQAVEIGTHPGALDLLHRDVANVATWFARKDVPIDVEVTFADLVGAALRA